LVKPTRLGQKYFHPSSVCKNRPLKAIFVFLLNFTFRAENSTIYPILKNKFSNFFEYKSKNYGI